MIGVTTSAGEGGLGDWQHDGPWSSPGGSPRGHGQLGRGRILNPTKTSLDPRGTLRARAPARFSIIGSPEEYVYGHTVYHADANYPTQRYHVSPRLRLPRPCPPPRLPVEIARLVGRRTAGELAVLCICVVSRCTSIAALRLKWPWQQAEGEAAAAHAAYAACFWYQFNWPLSATIKYQLQPCY